MSNKEKAVDSRPHVKVIATARGWDGARMREVGEVFLVPAAMFDKRPRMVKSPAGPMVEDGHYDAPSWFEEAEDVEVSTTTTTTKKDAAKKKGDDIG